MKVLILGATGGTGREIVREAGAQGHSVVALVRSKANGDRSGRRRHSLRATRETSRSFRSRLRAVPA